MLDGFVHLGASQASCKETNHTLLLGIQKVPTTHKPSSACFARDIAFQIDYPISMLRKSIACRALA
jgi:hypothetical protein